MILDWIDDHFGWVITVVLAVVFGFIVMVSVGADHEAAAHCAHLLSLAKSAHDTLEVSIACEAPRHNQTTVMPMPIIIPR